MGRKIGIVCIVLGVLLLLSAAGLLVYNKLEDRNAGIAAATALPEIKRDIEERKTAGEQTSPETPEVIPGAPEKDDNTAREMSVVEYDGYEYIGYISIPAVGIELPVMSEWDYTRLTIAPCRQFGSIYTDDLVIAAHNYASFFKNLHMLGLGDVVVFTDADGVQLVYEVVATSVVDPTDVEEVRNSGCDLVLYTCTPGGRTRVVIGCNRYEAK